MPLDSTSVPLWVQSEMQIAEAYKVLGAAKAHAPPGSPQLLLNAVDTFLWNTRGQMCVGDVKVRPKPARCKAEKRQTAANSQLLVLQGLILDEVIAKCRPKVQYVHATISMAGHCVACSRPSTCRCCQASRQLFTTDWGPLQQKGTCLLTGRCPCSLL